MFLLVNFIKIVVFICKQASEKLKCFYWRRIIIFHKIILIVLFIFMAFTFFVAFCILSVIHKQ